MASRLADYLIQQPLYSYGMQQFQQNQEPVRSPLEGLARALTQGLGGYFAGQGLRAAREEQSGDQRTLAKAMELYATDPVGSRALLASRPGLADVGQALLMQDAAFQNQIGLAKAKQDLETDQLNAERQGFGLPPVPKLGGGVTTYNGPQQAGGNAANAIASIESQGQPNNGYGAVNPTSGALGRYQVMPSNVGPWTKRWLGREMAPQEFLQSPQAQDAVFNGQFGEYRQKYGDNGAARAWFAGEGGMNNPRAADANGTTVAQYEQRFAGANGPQVAQGAGPQVAPGQPAPQQAANVPQSDTINYAGIDLPRAEVAAAFSIRDQKERASKLTDIVREAVKRKQGPDPGTTAGDVHVLDRVFTDPTFASTLEYRTAYDRVHQPQMSANGQLLYPSSRYPKPITEQGTGGPPKPVFQDTPASQFNMGRQAREEFNALQPVKNWREIAPIIASMRDAQGRDNKVADLNLIYGLAKVMDPNSVVREGEMVMVRNTQSLPEWVRGALQAAIAGKSAFTPEQREKIMTEVESRAGALRSQFEELAKNYGAIGQKYNIPQDEIVSAPTESMPRLQGGGVTGGTVYDITGKPLR